MAYRLTEEDLARIQSKQATDLSNFQRNSGRGLPAATVKAMEKAAGVKMDEHGAPVPKAIRKGKYHNLPTEADDIKFHSKLEAKYYVELDFRRKAGDLLYFLRQVPFHLPGGVIYRVDFLEVSLHHEYAAQMTPAPKMRALDKSLGFTPLQIRYVDCKGVDTQDSSNKIKMVQAIYGVEIELVRKVKTHRKL